MTTKKIIFILIISFISSYAFSQSLKYRKYSNEFLSIGVGARNIGMANTGISTVNDVTSGYWNPAGLSLIKSNIQLGLMHSEHFAGIVKHDYGAIAARIDDKSAVGFSIIRSAIDDIPNTMELFDSDGNMNYDRITSFSVADYGFLISYARKSKKEGLRYGANLKTIRRKIGTFASGWGFGLDVGVQYDVKSWKFGLMARDITYTFNAWKMTFTDAEKEVLTITNNVIPENSIEVTTPKFIPSIAKKFEFMEHFGALIVADVDITTDGKRAVLISGNTFSIDPHMGMELSYKNILFLRGGLGNIQYEKSLTGEEFRSFQMNIGLGIMINNSVSIDYALTDLGDKSIAIFSNVFSIRLHINRNDNTQNTNSIPKEDAP